MRSGIRRADTRQRRLSTDVVTGVLVLFVLAAGMSTTAMFATTRRAQAHHEFEAQYRFGRQQAMHGLEAGLERYAAALRGAAGLISSSNHVDMAEFDRYSRSLDRQKSLRGMRRIGFVQPVPWDGHEQFMVEMLERVPGALSEVSGPPHELAIVTLMTDGPRGVGRDLALSPQRRVALDRARDLGTVQMTTPVSLVIDPRSPRDHEPSSVAMYAPVYGTTEQLLTAEHRRAHLIGWTTTVFPLKGLPAALGLANSLAEVRLFPDEVSLSAAPVGAHSRVETVELFGQPWRVVFDPGPALSAPSEVWRAIVWAGGSTTIGVACIVGLLGTQRARLRREVRVALARSDAAHRELELNDRFRSALLGNLQVGVVATDLERNIQAYNLNSEGLHDSDAPEFCGAWSDVLPLWTPAGIPLAEHLNPMARALRGERVRGEEYFVRPRGGTERVVLCNGQPITDERGATLGAVVTMHDVSSLKAAQERLADLALHDPLTGLPNRVALMEKTHAALVRARQTDLSVAMLFIDLDGFKSVNDEYGHDIGDELLRVAAARLQVAVRSTDTPARLGGDEFVVLCDGYDDDTEPRRVAERIQASLSRPYPVSRATMQISLSVGVAFACPGDDAASLLRRADQAMYRAKLRSRPPLPEPQAGCDETQTWVAR